MNPTSNLLSALAALGDLSPADLDSAGLNASSTVADLLDVLAKA